MKITSPKDPSPYVGNTLGDDYIVPIPASGIIKLQLIPSLRYKSKGEYIVRYYKRGNFTNHFREERWVVPAVLPLQTVSTEITGTTNSIQLSYPVFEVQKVDPVLPFIIEYDTVLFTQNLPIVGTRLNITYQPAVTLDTLIRLGEIRDNGYGTFNSFNAY